MSVKGQTAATANVAAAAAITFAGQMLPCNATGLTHIFFFLAPTHFIFWEARDQHTSTQVLSFYVFIVFHLQQTLSQNAQMGSKVFSFRSHRS